MNTSARETSDPTLAAITQAIEEFARIDGLRSRPEDQDFRQQGPPYVGPKAVSPGRRLAFGKVAVWSLIGFLAIVCVAAIVFAWPISDGRTAKSTPIPQEAAPAPISPAAVEKETVTTQAIPSIAATRIDKSPEQPAVQPQIVPRPAEPAVSVSAEMTERFRTLERRLTNLEQGIEQAKADQARLARESSELVGNLGEALEKLVLRVGTLASEVKAAEENAARDRLTAAEQLSVSQEQLAKVGEQLKASQEQIDRLKAGTQRRVVRLAPPQPQSPNARSTQPQSPNAPSTRKPASKPPSPQARVSPAQSLLPSQAR